MKLREFLAPERVIIPLESRTLEGAGAELLERVLAAREVLEAIHATTSAQELVELEAFATYQLPEQLTVRDVMTDQPRTVLADTPLKEAARTMVRSGLGALPVIDAERRVLGMVSERDVIRHLLTTQVFSGADVRSVMPPGSAPRNVRDIMSRQVMCVAPEQPIAEVASLMSNKDVDRVPVVREGQLVGFLTRGDIVRKLIGN